MSIRVCSQDRSEYPSKCVLPDAHHCRYQAPSNAHVRCQELETSDGNGLGNATADGLWSPKGNACPGYANTTSPFKSSWIQRLIPSQTTRREEPQHSRENQSFDGVGISSKQNVDWPAYENSRRSKHVFLSGNQACGVGTALPACKESAVNIDATSTLYKVPEFPPPEIQVSPKPLPVVESLLLGCSKKAVENQTSTETELPHTFSRCSGLISPVQQTVHYSADKKSRISCSTIEGLNSHSVMCAAGYLLSCKSLQTLDRRIDSLQSSSEILFNSHDAMAMSDIDPAFAAKDGQVGTNLRTWMASTQTEDRFEPLCREDRYPKLQERWAPSVARFQSVKSSSMDRDSMFHRAESTEPLEECVPQATLLAERSVLSFNVDDSISPKAISNGACENPYKRCTYVREGYEALHSRTGPCDEGWWSLCRTEKNIPYQCFNLVSSHCRTSLVQENSYSSTSDHMVTQALHSSSGSHEQHDGTSGSFSFHLENQSSDYSSLFTRTAQWPFGPSQPSSEDLVQVRLSEDNKIRSLAQVTTTAPQLPNHSIFVGTGMDEAGTVQVDRGLKESASGRISDSHEALLYKAACGDIRGVSVKGVNEQSVVEGRSLPGGHKGSWMESSLIEAMEGIEPMYSLPGAVNVNNWKTFKPSTKNSNYTCLPEGTRLNPTDGNRFSENNWKGFKPSISSSSHTCPPEAINLYGVDGKLSMGSVRSSSTVPASLWYDYPPSTIVEARSRSSTQVKQSALWSVALQDELHSSWRESGGFSENTSTDDRQYEGEEALPWDGPGSAVKKNVWLQRWSDIRLRNFLPVSRLKKQGRVVAGRTHTRNYLEDYGTSQGKRGYLHCFDLRPAKRMCYESGSGLQPLSGNAISHHTSVVVEGLTGEKGMTSHFMKRFFSPSVVALAIMGMTARKMHAKKSDKQGLFGVGHPRLQGGSLLQQSMLKSLRIS